MDEAAPRLTRSLLPPNSALRSLGYKKEGDKEKAASQQAPTEAAKKNKAQFAGTASEQTLISSN